MKRRESDREQELNPDELFADTDFHWPVSASGYHWEKLPWIRSNMPKGLEDKAWVLTDGVPVNVRYEVRRYWPLKVSEMFRKFADLPPDNKEQIVAFANEFGKLGISVQIALPPQPLPVEPTAKSGSVQVMGQQSGKAVPVGELGFGERFDTWRDAIRSIKRAVLLHTLISSNAIAQLKKLIFRRNDYWIFEQLDDLRYSKLIRSRDFELPKDNVLPPARLCLQHWINEHLRDHAAPQVLWDRDHDKHVFRLMPMNLLGALWFQLARVVVGEVKYRPCKVCGKVLTISADKDGYRVDREFCSAACRQRDHRRKVREAKELRAKGRSVRAIAKHFDTSIETIKGWLSKER